MTKRNFWTVVASRKIILKPKTHICFIQNFEVQCYIQKITVPLKIKNVTFASSMGLCKTYG